MAENEKDGKPALDAVQRRWRLKDGVTVEIQDLMAVMKITVPGKGEYAAGMNRWAFEELFEQE